MDSWLKELPHKPANQHSTLTPHIRSWMRQHASLTQHSSDKRKGETGRGSRNSRDSGALEQQQKQEEILPLREKARAGPQRLSSGHCTLVLRHPHIHTQQSRDWGGGSVVSSTNCSCL